MAPVGQASRHPAISQCLQTSEENSHERCSASFPPNPGAGVAFHELHVAPGRVTQRSGVVVRISAPVQSVLGSIPFHSLHATSQALQPMHKVESVRKPVWSALMPLLHLLAQCQIRPARPPRSGSMSQTRALVSMIRTFGSSRNGQQIVDHVSFTARDIPSDRAVQPDALCGPQPERPHARSHQDSRLYLPRGVVIVAHPPCSNPISAASSGETSQNNSGCNSAQDATSCRDMPPAV